MEEVIIFGTGRYYLSKKEDLQKKYKIVGFLDNAMKPGGSGKFEEIELYHPEDFALLPEAPIFIMSAKFYEMSMQLLSLGVAKDRIRFGVNLMPYYDETERIFADLNLELWVEDHKLILQNTENTYSFADEKEYKEVLRELYIKRNLYIKLIADMPLKPISKRFGDEMGTPIDRYYIEKFLYDNQKYIHGSVMEIADNSYTMRFGKNVSNSYILHVNGWGKNVIKGNLATGEGISENAVDCLICTQTIQFIYDFSAVAANIYKILKPGGTALITAHGISQLSMYDYQNWGEYWRFTDMAMRKILCECFPKDSVEVCSYGNVKTTICFLYGLCIENLLESDFEYNDEQYPMVIAAVARKEEGIDI